MSMVLSYLLTMLLLVTPSAVELYIWTDVLSWGQTISMIFCRMGNIALAVMKRPASSALTAEDMTNLIIWDIVRMYTLSRVTGSSSDRKMWDPARLQDLETLR